jgi:hypothetical protein
MTLNERIQFAKEEDHDIILVKNGKYMSGSWDEKEYAEKRGWKFVGTVAQLWRENN